MAKIQMKTPLVEMDGDEMTRIIWQDIRIFFLLHILTLKQNTMTLVLFIEMRLTIR